MAQTSLTELGNTLLAQTIAHEGGFYYPTPLIRTRMFLVGKHYFRIDLLICTLPEYDH